MTCLFADCLKCPNKAKFNCTCSKRNIRMDINSVCLKYVFGSPVGSLLSSRLLTALAVSKIATEEERSRFILVRDKDDFRQNLLLRGKTVEDLLYFMNSTHLFLAGNNIGCGNWGVGVALTINTDQQLLHIK